MDEQAALFDELQAQDAAQRSQAQQQAARQHQQQQQELAHALRRISNVKELASILNSKNPQRVLRGIVRFTRQTRNDLEAEKTDVHATLAARYLRGSPQCAELMFLLRTLFKGQYRESARVVDLLAALLTLARDTDLQNTAVNVAMSLMRSQLGMISHLLSADDHSVVHPALRLMIALVQLDITVAQEFVRRFNFGMQAFTRLPGAPWRNRGGKAQAQAVSGDALTGASNAAGQPLTAKQLQRIQTRGLFINLTLALLAFQEPKITHTVLGVRNFVQGVLKGLVADPPEVVVRVLSSLLQDVVQLDSVGTQAKLRFFNGYVLEQLVALYAVEPVADAVHVLLTALLKMGSGGETAVTRLLPKLRANEDSRQQQLVLTTLEQNPSLIVWYVEHLPYTFEPRLSHRWLANVTLLCKVYALDVDPKFFLKRRASRAAPGALQLSAAANLVQALFPASLTKLTLSQGLQHASTLVRFHSMLLMHAIFGAFARLLHAVRTELAVTELSELMFLSAELRRRLPDPQVLLRLHHKADAASKKRSLDGQTANGAASDDAPAAADLIPLMYMQFLAVIEDYQLYTPEALTDARIDVWKFLTPEVLTMTPVSQLRIVRLLASAPASHSAMRLWSRAASPTHSTVTNFGLLLVLWARHMRPAADQRASIALADMLEALLIESMHRTGVFAAHPGQARLLLHALATEADVAFLETVMIVLERNPHAYVSSQVLPPVTPPSVPVPAAVPTSPSHMSPCQPFLASSDATNAPAPFVLCTLSILAGKAALSGTPVTGADVRRVGVTGRDYVLRVLARIARRQPDVANHMLAQALHHSTQQQLDVVQEPAAKKTKHVGPPSLSALQQLVADPRAVALLRLLENPQQADTVSPPMPDKKARKRARAVVRFLQQQAQAPQDFAAQLNSMLSDLPRQALDAVLADTIHVSLKVAGGVWPVVDFVCLSGTNLLRLPSVQQALTAGGPGDDPHAMLLRLALEHIPVDVLVRDFAATSPELVAFVQKRLERQFLVDSRADAEDLVALLAKVVGTLKHEMHTADGATLEGACALLTALQSGDALLPMLACLEVLHRPPSLDAFLSDTPRSQSVSDTVVAALAKVHNSPDMQSLPVDLSAVVSPYVEHAYRACMALLAQNPNDTTQGQLAPLHALPTLWPYFSHVTRAQLALLGVQPRGNTTWVSFLAAADLPLATLLVSFGIDVSAESRLIPADPVSGRHASGWTERLLMALAKQTHSMGTKALDTASTHSLLASLPLEQHVDLTNVLDSKVLQLVSQIAVAEDDEDASASRAVATNAARLMKCCRGLFPVVFANFLEGVLEDGDVQIGAERWQALLPAIRIMLNELPTLHPVTLELRKQIVGIAKAVVAAERQSDAEDGTEVVRHLLNACLPTVEDEDELLKARAEVMNFLAGLSYLHDWKPRVLGLWEVLLCKLDKAEHDERLVFCGEFIAEATHALLFIFERSNAVDNTGTQLLPVHESGSMEEAVWKLMSSVLDHLAATAHARGWTPRKTLLRLISSMPSLDPARAVSRLSTFLRGSLRSRVQSTDSMRVINKMLRTLWFSNEQHPAHIPKEARDGAARMEIDDDEEESDDDDEEEEEDDSSVLEQLASGRELLDACVHLESFRNVMLPQMMHVREANTMPDAAAAAEASDALLRTEVCELLYTLASCSEEQPELASPSWQVAFRLLLAAYGGRLTSLDMAIKSVLDIFIERGVTGGPLDWHVRWGSACARVLMGQYGRQGRDIRRLGTSGASAGVDPQASFDQSSTFAFSATSRFNWVYSNFDRSWLHRGVTGGVLPPVLPQSRALGLAEDVRKHRHSLHYDPRFVLPFFESLIANCNVDCRQLIEMGVVSFTVWSMSSPDVEIRQLAYSVMQLLFGLLEAALPEDEEEDEGEEDEAMEGVAATAAAAAATAGEEPKKEKEKEKEKKKKKPTTKHGRGERGPGDFREQPQMLALLSVLRNAITEPFQQIPALAASFVAHAQEVVMKLDHTLYREVNRFLLQRPMLDFGDVPMFYAMFNSGSDTMHDDRRWILRVIAPGLVSLTDYEILQRRHAFAMLFSCYDSHLMDERTRGLVHQVVRRAAGIPLALRDLVDNHGLVSWLRSALAVASREGGEQVEQLCGLLRSVVKSYVAVDQALFDGVGEDDQGEEEEEDSSERAWRIRQQQVVHRELALALPSLWSMLDGGDVQPCLVACVVDVVRSAETLATRFAKLREARHTRLSATLALSPRVLAGLVAWTDEQPESGDNVWQLVVMCPLEHANLDDHDEAKDVVRVIDWSLQWLVERDGDAQRWLAWLHALLVRHNRLALLIAASQHIVASLLAVYRLPSLRATGEFRLNAVLVAALASANGLADEQTSASAACQLIQRTLGPELFPLLPHPSTADEELARALDGTVALWASRFLALTLRRFMLEHTVAFSRAQSRRGRAESLAASNVDELLKGTEGSTPNAWHEFVRQSIEQPERLGFDDEVVQVATRVLSLSGSVE